MATSKNSTPPEPGDPDHPSRSDRIGTDGPTVEAFFEYADGDELSMLLRSHLALELLLNFALVDVEDVAAGQELDRLPFMAKVDVVIALGKLSPPMRTAFATVNRIRNRFAHHLGARITKADAEQLIAVLSDHDRATVQKYNEPDVATRVAMAMALIYMEAADQAGTPWV